MRWPKQLILLFAAKLICSSSANLILPGAKKDNGGNLKVKFEKFTPPRYSWTGTNVRFPTDEIRNDYLDNGKFIMKNSIQSKFQVSKLKGDVIVTMPRFKEATPITLARVDFSSSPCSPSFFPFPSWELQEVGKKGAIQSAVDLKIDTMNRLFVLDSGVVTTLSHANRTFPPQVLMIDLLKSKSTVLQTIDLSTVADSKCKLENMAVDSSVFGAPFLYIGDSFNNHILVWDVQNNKGRSIKLPRHTMDGCAKSSTLYLELSRHQDNSLLLYFTQFCSKKLFSVDTALLRSGTDVTNKIVTVGDKPAGTVILGTDNVSSMFLRHGGSSKIYRWDSNTSFEAKNFTLVYEGDQCKMSTAVAPGPKKMMFGLDSNYEDFVMGRVGCLGPSVSLFPLVRPSGRCVTCSVL